MKNSSQNVLAILGTTLFFLLNTVGTVNAQVPQRITYQAIARNASGAAIANTAVKVRFSIRDSIATGPVRYLETHTTETSELGLFSVNVGAGLVVSGSFSGINWGKNGKFLQVELDPAGGNTFTNLGTTQMMSVPYALNSGNGVANGTSNNQIMYWNGTSWTQLNPGSNGQTLTICNGVLTWTTGGICPANLPALSTSTVSAVTTTTASSGGNITSDGGSSITARGVCWSTSQNPTVALSTKTSNGMGTGSFTSSIIGLSPNTLYFLRAYATNSAGTAYGNQISFTSGASSSPTDADGNTYSTITIGPQVWMKENLKTTKYRNNNPILSNLTNLEWSSITSGACAIFYNNTVNDSIYGKLYNWYAVTDPRGLCPVGWHVPTGHDFNLLIKYLEPLSDTIISCSGCINGVGGKMKSTGTIQAGTGLWQDPNT
jgi:uncharacterized protein (TIGR02145 family)